VNRRDLLAMGAATLALPIALPPVVAHASATASGLRLYDSRYPRTAAVLSGRRRYGRWQDLHGIDPVRLWRQTLLPALDAGALVSGCSTFATWQVMRYSALEARHQAQLLPLAADAEGSVTLVAWQLLPRRRQATPLA
jgi:hypothetical protein